jgi:purine-binding chemotaxis protein CheW
VQSRGRDVVAPAAAGRALLRARAERYATVQSDARPVLCSAVTFRRAASAYALPLSGLREIRPLSNPCELPGSSPVVRGIVYYRGELLSLHDLSVFSSGVVPKDSPPWVIVMEHAGVRIGLVADELMDVVEVETGEVHPVPVTLGDAADVFMGVTGNGMLVVDVARTFESSRFISAF